VLAKGRIPDSGARKKLSGFSIRNLVKLVNLAPQEKKEEEKESEEEEDDEVEEVDEEVELLLPPSPVNAKENIRQKLLTEMPEER
jgi:hypothetical protein